MTDDRLIADRRDVVNGTFTAAERKLSGKAIQRATVELAGVLGWWWCHWRAAPRPPGRGKGWAVPVEGPLGTGWPDVFLAQPATRRIMAFEVKAYADELTAEQLNVLGLLQAGGVEVHVLGPQHIREPLEGSLLYAILTTSPKWTPRPVLAEIAGYADSTARILRRQNVVFDRWPPKVTPAAGWTPENMAALDRETYWQGVAFTLYSDLVLGAAAKAEQALKDLDDALTDVNIRDRIVDKRS